MTTRDAGAEDALADWCRVRREVDWPRAGGPEPRAAAPSTDGFVTWCQGPVRRRSPGRADRLLSAYAAARADAARRAPLTFARLAGWQRLLLGTAEAPFRTGDAHAKGGRERYRLTSHTEADFARCLRDGEERGVPLAARAARTYLDVAFFHPFADGNARSALLALCFVLAREGVVLNEVGPLQTTRYADDAPGAADLAALVALLIAGPGRRRAAALEGGRRSRGSTCPGWR
ncbi:Fic family protein [Streptomyces sp. NPDC002587]